MIQRFLAKIEVWAKRGIYVPFVHDPERDKPSVTLMFFYLSYIVANLAVVTSSILMLLNGDYYRATIMPVSLLVMGFVFYRLRNLDRVKFDLDDQEIELSSDDEKEEKNDEKD